MTDFTLLSFITDQAVQQVGDNAEPAWFQSALDTVKILAERKEPFTTDDVWDLLKTRQTTETHEPRAMGAVMRQAKSIGLVAPTSEYRLSRRIECHQRPIRVWMPQ